MPPLAPRCRRLLLAGIAALIPLTTLASDNVTITVSPVLPGTTLARAGADPATSLVTVLGETVTLTLTQGREYVLSGIGPLGGGRFDTTPPDGDILRVTPEARAEGDGYLLRIQTSRWRAGQVRVFSSTVAAEPGEWVQLWGQQEPRSRKVNRLSAGAREDALYVQVLP